MTPHYIARNADSFRSSIERTPAQVVKTTAKHVGSSSSKGKLGSKGSHLKGTPYNPKWGDMGIPKEIRAFFRRDMMGAEFDVQSNIDLRKALIHADVLLHNASNRLIQGGSTGQDTAAKSYVQIFEEIQTLLAQRT